MTARELLASPVWRLLDSPVLVMDCVEAMAAMPDGSVDAVVCDPPYSLTFMGRSWDSFTASEDPGFCYWLTGLIDGEGCFSIKRHTRGTHAPAFGLKMRADEAGTLHRIRAKLGFGTITYEQRTPNPMVRWNVADRHGCGKLVVLLDKYPLRAKKRRDYAIWRKAVLEWLGRPRGNRWRGAADNEPMAALRAELMGTRAYDSAWETRWSGHEYQDWTLLWAREALRVLKPGGFLLAFGGTRTYHRLACAVEDAGFEVRDSLNWVYGSGFPKSLNVSLAIDKAARGVPQGGVDPSSPNHGKLLGGHPGAGPGKWLKPGDIDPKTGRKVVGSYKRGMAMHPGNEGVDNWRESYTGEVAITEPATPAAREWDGWGTALKPAHEPIVVARKPFKGNVAGNVLAHGTAALNIDACRIKAEGRPLRTSESSASGLTGTGGANTYGSFAVRGSRAVGETTEGRWPTNVLLSHAPECVCRGTRRVKSSSPSVPEPQFESAEPGVAYDFKTGVGRTDRMSDGYAPDGTEVVEDWECVEDCPVRLLDAQSGERAAGGAVRGSEPSRTGESGIYGHFERVANRAYDDVGGASRFFPTFRYEPKASAAEREAGVWELDEQLFAQSQGAQAALARGEGEYQDVAGSSNGLNVVKRRRNTHPTVKPIDLMRWLVRLVTPPGGVVLDPFLGSGTTGAAAALEGFEFVGVEQDATYAEIARKRIAFWAEHPTDLPIERALDAERDRGKQRDRGQMDLFG